MNKKGISLVALVITIIVLIILTAAVIITGVNAPQNAQSAVADYNLQVVQDAVTIYVMNHIANNATASSVPTVADAVAILTGTSVTTDTAATAFASSAAAALGIGSTDGYKVDGKGKVTKA